MSMLLKEMPQSERPRERLVKYGVHSLANYELLAIILRTGTRNRSVIAVAKELLARYERLDRLNEATIEELKEIQGVGDAKAIELLAAIELGRRINIPVINKVQLRTPQKSYSYLKHKLQHLTQEHLVAVYLNSQSEVVGEKTVSIGTINQTLFNYRDILKWGLKLAATAIIIAHNHPSGNPTPSHEDNKMTQKIKEAARVVDLLVVDHIIIGKDRYFSYAENKKL